MVTHCPSWTFHLIACTKIKLAKDSNHRGWIQNFDDFSGHNVSKIHAHHVNPPTGLHQVGSGDYWHRTCKAIGYDCVGIPVANKISAGRFILFWKSVTWRNRWWQRINVNEKPAQIDGS